MPNNSPKRPKIAQKAISLHTLGVQVCGYSIFVVVIVVWAVFRTRPGFLGGSWPLASILLESGVHHHTPGVHQDRHAEREGQRARGVILFFWRPFEGSQRSRIRQGASMISEILVPYS